MPTRRPWLVISGAILSAGALTAAFVLLHGADPRYDDAREAARVLAQVDAEAPLASDVTLPVASHAAVLTKPHVRVELGNEHLRIGGREILELPHDGATSFDPWKRRRYASAAVVPVAQWARGVLDDAGVESRAVELAVDRNAPYGLIVECIASLREADFSSVLMLVRREDGALGVLRPTVGAWLLLPTLRVDPRGARVGAPGDAAATVSCTWTHGSAAAAFVQCLKEQIPDLRVERRNVVALAPTRDTSYGDLVVLMDALTDADVGFSFAVAALE